MNGMYFYQINNETGRTFMTLPFPTLNLNSFPVLILLSNTFSKIKKLKNYIIQFVIVTKLDCY